jgi:hypothetical protein
MVATGWTACATTTDRPEAARVVAGALLALVAAIALLVISLFVEQGLVLAWLSLLADALAGLLLVTALRRRSPRRPPAEP